MISIFHPQLSFSLALCTVLSDGLLYPSLFISVGLPWMRFDPLWMYITQPFSYNTIPPSEYNEDKKEKSPFMQPMILCQNLRCCCILPISIFNRHIISNRA